MAAPVYAWQRTWYAFMFVNGARDLKMSGGFDSQNGAHGLMQKAIESWTLDFTHDPQGSRGSFTS